MGIIFFTIICTLVTAAIWYFFCGGEESDKADAAKRESEGKEPSKGLGAGCITCLIIGLIMSICYVGYSVLMAD